jgi:hypothetical protein
VTTRRRDEIPRPKPWTVRAADLAAGKGWDALVAQRPEAADRTWVAMTSEPRRVDGRQHRLKGSLGSVAVGGKTSEQWQYEATAGGRVWYAIDDDTRTLWVTEAGPGHPKKTEPRHRKKRG